MSRVFYTYVWGSHGKKGGPLTFANKASRTTAIRSTEEGDLVFGVVSRTPSDPNVQIPENTRGRVVSVWQISHMTADTAEYGIRASNAWDRLPDGGYRWPYAIQPIRTWIVDDPPEFRELPGYTPATHTQRAITTLQEVDHELSTTLEALIHTGATELEVVTPRYKTIAMRVQQMRQKHPFALNAYSVQPDPLAMYSIYIATLGNGNRTIKIGHAQDAKQRVADFNKYRLAHEPQWTLHTSQLIGTVREAIAVEQYLGETFAAFRTEKNNNEIFVGLDPMVVLTKLATVRDNNVLLIS